MVTPTGDRGTLESDLRKKLSEVSALDIHITVVRRELHDIERTLGDNETIAEEFRKLLKESVDRDVTDLMEFRGFKRTLADLKADIVKNRNDLVAKRSELLTAERRRDELRYLLAKIEAELKASGSIVSWKTPKS